MHLKSLHAHAVGPDSWFGDTAAYAILHIPAALPPDAMRFADGL